MQCFVRVGRIHLITVFVAAFEVACRADCIAEGAIIVRRILGAVGHDLGVDMTGGFECLTYGADATIHHV